MGDIESIPEVDDVKVAFPSLDGGEISQWVTKANAADYDKEKWGWTADALFFNGGRLNWKMELSDEAKRRGLRYLKCWLGSFSPKHEEKALVAGYLLFLLTDGLE